MGKWRTSKILRYNPRLASGDSRYETPAKRGNTTGRAWRGDVRTVEEVAAELAAAQREGVPDLWERVRSVRYLCSKRRRQACTKNCSECRL